MLSRHVIALGIGVLLASVAGEHGIPALLQARGEARRVAAEIHALRTENAALRERARALRSDAMAIEAAARLDLGLARKDELVIVVRR
jgi:cell division protein FtsB